MSAHKSIPSPLAFSVGLYRLLILAYPREFRDEYEADMQQVFRDRCRERLSDSGVMGLLGWWLIAGIDFLASVLEQHLRKEHYMTRTTLIRIAGWALMVAALAFVLATVTLPEQDPNYTGMLFILLATLLTALGTLGVIAQFSAVVGSATRATLLFGALASLLVLTSFTDYVWEFSEWGWVIPFFGPMILLASLGVFGIVALRRNILRPVVSWALIAGFWFLALLLGALSSAIAGREPAWDLLTAAYMVGSFITAYGLARLGWMLVSRPEARPQAAAT